MQGLATTGCVSTPCWSSESHRSHTLFRRVSTQGRSCSDPHGGREEPGKEHCPPLSLCTLLEAPTNPPEGRRAGSPVLHFLKGSSPGNMDRQERVADGSGNTWTYAAQAPVLDVMARLLPFAPLMLWMLEDNRVRVSDSAQSCIPRAISLRKQLLQWSPDPASGCSPALGKVVLGGLCVAPGLHHPTSQMAHDMEPSVEKSQVMVLHEALWTCHELDHQHCLCKVQFPFSGV